MGFARPLMWNVPHWAEITLYCMIPLVVIALLAGLVWRVRKWTIGRAEPGGTWWAHLRRNLSSRKGITEFLKSAFLQWRLSRDGYAIAMHLAIFWGMLVLFLGTALATIDQDFTNLPFDFQILTGNFYRFFELVLDAFGVVLIVGVAMAAYRRYVTRPERLTAKEAKISKWDAFPFLACLALIALTGFVVEGLRIAEGFQIERRLSSVASTSGEAEIRGELEDKFHLLGEPRRQREVDRITAESRVFPAAAWAPVGYALAVPLSRFSPSSIQRLHQFVWWSHALLAFGFLIAIPLTKAFHLFSSPLYLLIRDTHSPAGRLTVAAESGVGTIRDFTWRQLMQLDACTWCGRCREACPGHASGAPISPRDVVQRLESALLRTPRVNGNGQHLLGEMFSADTLWSCCTCRACEDVCPVGVEHPRLLIDMRRHLVDQGEIDEGLQDALMNFQRYGNSFGLSPRKRAAWAKQLENPPKDACREEVEYVWFVGDYASYDQRLRDVTLAIARLFDKAGLEVGLLYEKEQNAGNDVRRVGEEGLFEMLREKNLRILEKTTFRHIVTTDPHTYNTLKNEYASCGNGATALCGKTVLHYTELLDALLREEQLLVQTRLECTATYHDPCYLGRYNGVYDTTASHLGGVGRDTCRVAALP